MKEKLKAFFIKQWEDLKTDLPIIYSKGLVKTTIVNSLVYFAVGAFIVWVRS